MKFIKKPVEIEAFVFCNDSTSYSLLHWANENQHSQGRDFVSWENDCLLIPTLEGVMKANVGDYIIRGVQGELYPCKPDIFEATYEQVE